MEQMTIETFLAYEVGRIYPESVEDGDQLLVQLPGNRWTIAVFDDGRLFDLCGDGSEPIKNVRRWAALPQD